MVEVIAIIAACAAVFAAGIIAVAAILTASMKLPLPGFKNKEAIARTRGVRLAALTYAGMAMLVVAAVAGSYGADYASLADYKLATNAGVRNLYPLAAIPLLVLMALSAASVLALHQSGALPVVFASAATGVLIFLHPQVDGGATTIWGVLIAGVFVSTALTLAILYQIATTRMHMLHWATLALYGVTAIAMWLMTFFTYPVNVFGQDKTLYYAFPWISIGGGLLQSGLAVMASVHTNDGEDEPEDDEEPLELPVTKAAAYAAAPPARHVHGHAARHRSK